MTKKKKQSDINILAKQILEETTQEKNKKKPTKEKNPAAVALGRLGGLKGGPARAKKLSKEERKAIAREAAKTRWAKK